VNDPKEIFLAPYCESADDRRWCEDDMAGDWCHCDECKGKPSVRYVRADLYAELDAQLVEALKENKRQNQACRYTADLCEQYKARITEVLKGTPHVWEAKVNGVHTVYFDREPPDDAYDEGTLIPLYCAAQTQERKDER